MFEYIADCIGALYLKNQIEVFKLVSIFVILASVMIVHQTFKKILLLQSI